MFSVVCILLQLSSCFETSAEKSPCIVWKTTALIPQYLLTRLLPMIFSRGFFHFFQQFGWWFPWKWVTMCLWHNGTIVKCPIQKQTTATACFVFINHTRNVFFSSIGQLDVLPLFVFLENCVFGKNPLKICKTVRNEEATVNRETLRKAVKPCDTQWNCEIWEVWCNLVL